MKVWIIGEQQEGVIYGVFSTEEAAKTYAMSLMSDDDGDLWDVFFMESREVQ